jgi:hypothetical protein
MHVDLGWPDIVAQAACTAMIFGARAAWRWYRRKARLGPRAR